MDPRFLTILIVPGDQGRRSIRVSVSRNFLIALSLVLLLTVGGVLGLLTTWNRSAALAVDLEKAVAERDGALNAEHRSRLNVFQLSRRLENLTGALEDFQKLSEPDFVPDFIAAGGVVEDPLLDFEDPSFYAEPPAMLGEVMSEKADFWVRLLQDKIQDRLVLLSCTPSVLPVNGLITYGYSWRRDPFTGKRSFHAGLDISARRGTPIQAPADGVVTKAGWMHGYGKVVEINHGYGVTTRYGHMNRIIVQPGEVIERGQSIGEVGSTGRSTGPHLHYEVLENGKPVNPVPRYILEDPYISSKG